MIAAEPLAPVKCETSRIELLGMPLDCLTQHEALALLTQRIEARRGTWVLTPNLDILRRYKKGDARIRSLFHAADEGADILLADGMPLVWASRLAKGGRLPERVAGSSLVVALAKLAAEHRWRLFLLGGELGAADRAAAVLQGRHPKLVLCGTHCPPPGFENDARQMAEINAKLRDANPDLVYVALGFPKQEELIRQLRATLPRATFIGVGISLSFIAGTVHRAPRWLQRIGLEWAHRLCQEPRRLAKRYLWHDLPFALFVLFPWALASHFRPRSRHEGAKKPRLAKKLFKDAL